MISIIRAIVASLTGPPVFYHGTSKWQNLNADKADLDDGIVYLDEPITSDDDLTQGGYIEEAYPLRLMFLKKSKIDWPPTQNKVIISEMRTLRRKFLNKLQDDAGVRYVSDVVTTDVMNVLDANLSGVLVEVTVTPFNSESACSE